MRAATFLSLPRVVERRGGVVNRTRADDGEHAVVLPMQDAADLLARFGDELRGALGQRRFLDQDGGRDERALRLDAHVVGGAEHGPSIARRAGKSPRKCTRLPWPGGVAPNAARQCATPAIVSPRHPAGRGMFAAGLFAGCWKTESVTVSADGDAAKPFPHPRATRLVSRTGARRPLSGAGQGLFQGRGTRRDAPARRQQCAGDAIRRPPARRKSANRPPRRSSRRSRAGCRSSTSPRFSTACRPA